jgi:hypothetical protein
MPRTTAAPSPACFPSRPNAATETRFYLATNFATGTFSFTSPRLQFQQLRVPSFAPSLQTKQC